MYDQTYSRTLDKLVESPKIGKAFMGLSSPLNCLKNIESNKMTEIMASNNTLPASPTDSLRRYGMISPIESDRAISCEPNSLKK